MRVPEGVAKLFGTESAAADSPHGMGSAKVSSPTWSLEEEAELTRRQIVSGRVAGRTDATSENSTPARSGLLSSAEREHLAVMKQARRDGYMLSMADCDVLLAWLDRAMQRG